MGQDQYPHNLVQLSASSHLVQYIAKCHDIKMQLKQNAKKNKRIPKVTGEGWITG